MDRYKCPHCEELIDYVNVSYIEHTKITGSARIGEHAFEDIDTDDSDVIDTDEYEYTCPECSEELAREDLERVDAPAAGTPPHVNPSISVNGWVEGESVVVDFHDADDDEIRHPNVQCYVRIVSGLVYLCQNVMAGADCGAQKYGCRYSWTISTGTPADCDSHGVRNIRRGTGNVTPSAFSTNTWVTG